jgi:hypothetical protein
MRRLVPNPGGAFAYWLRFDLLGPICQRSRRCATWLRSKCETHALQLRWSLKLQSRCLCQQASKGNHDRHCVAGFGLHSRYWTGEDDAVVRWLHQERMQRDPAYRRSMRRCARLKRFVAGLTCKGFGHFWTQTASSDLGWYWRRSYTCRCCKSTHDEEKPAAESYAALYGRDFIL